MFCKIGVLKNLTKIQIKTPVLESNINKVPLACNFIKKTLQRKCFPVTFARFLREIQNTTRWLVLKFEVDTETSNQKKIVVNLPSEELQNRSSEGVL